MTGQMVSHYRIGEQLGAGGMGVVYQAEDVRLKRRVALKFLPLELTRDSEAMERLVMEAQAASSLDHPNICVIHEIDEAEDGRLFIAMAFYDGETLKQRIARGAVPAAEAVALISQLAHAVAAAHQAGIVHRDIKPANVIITQRGELKLLDFGIAKLGGQTRITRTGTTLGTVAYMAPEQIAGAEADTRSDVWAIGVVLFEMLTGRLPFEGTTEIALMNAIVNRPPQPLGARPDVPPGVHAALARMLVKQPEERFSSATEIADALTAPPAAAAGPGSRRRPWKTAAVAAVVLVAFGAPAGWKSKRDRDARLARAAVVSEVKRLLEDERYVAAYIAAVSNPGLMKEDPSLGGLWEAGTVKHSMTSDPPGVRVSVRELAPTASWQFVGDTPLTDVRLPRGAARWRFEKTGYETLERLNGGPTDSLPQSVALQAEREGGVIRIGAMSLALFLVGFDYNRSVRGDAFDIDRLEVTNRQFKAFVDAGGYTRQEFWREPFVRDGRSLAWAQAMSLFKDGTGRPGPATWEVGSYQAGRDDYPVTGVSWYEAAAYARFRGRALPTIYHWVAAAGPWLSPHITPHSNIGGTGLLPAGQAAAVSPSGLSDVAGNAKEWCWNETAAGGTRYVLGGAWDEPEYMFLYGDAKSPFDRAANIGFRTAKYASAVAPELTAAISVRARDYGELKPVSNEVFAVYRTLHAYDASPLDAAIEETDERHPSFRRELVTFRTAYGQERLSAQVLLPKHAKPPYSFLVVWPGSNALRQKSVRDFDMTALSFLPASGRALVLPVLYGTFDRNDGRMSTWPDQSRAYREWAMRQVSDLRRTIDYIEGRSDLRRDAIGYLGMSWGARKGSIVLALDSRIRAGVFLSGGLSPGDAPPELDPFNFAPRVSVPVLMINGDEDFIFPLESSQKPLFQALGTVEAHKRHLVLPGSHAVQFEHRNRSIREVLDWLDRYLQ